MVTYQNLFTKEKTVSNSQKWLRPLMGAVVYENF